MKREPRGGRASEGGERRERARRIRRTVGRAVGLVVFVAWGAGMAVVWLPAMRLGARLRSADPAAPDVAAQASIHRAWRRYLAALEWLGVLRLRVLGAEALARGGPHLVVANHPTLLDTAYLASVLPQADFVVSPTWLRQPLLRRLARLAGYVRGGDGPHVVGQCARRLASGRTVVLFPEGTRSPPGGLGHFHRGAAHVALATGHALRPVLIRCEPPTLGKQDRWYNPPPDPFQVTVQMGGALPVGPACGAVDRGGDPGVRGESVPGRARAARELTAAVRELFAKGLEVADVRRTA